MTQNPPVTEDPTVTINPTLDPVRPGGRASRRGRPRTAPLRWQRFVPIPWPEAVAEPILVPMNRHVSVSRDGGPTDGPQLEDLVHRARSGLRDWTDTADGDPGVALLELFAFVGDLLSSHSERLAAEAHLGDGRRTEVEVDGHRWHQVEDLAGSGAEDLHYVVSRRGDGASVIEFGDGVHGRRPPADASIGVRYRHGGAYSSVVVHQGRVIIDTDVSELPVPAMCGVYPATVLDAADPLMHRRLLVRVPEVSADEPLWAAACLQVPDIPEGPSVGDGVWIAFESCDPSRPIWLGQRITD